MADLQRLVVRLEAESAKYQREIDAARKKLSVFEKATNSSVANIANSFKSALGSIAVGAIVTKLSTLTKGTLDWADSIGEAAGALGLSTKKYQELLFVTGQAGIKQDQFTQGFSKFVQLAEDAARGEKGPAAIFARIGVDAKASIDDVDRLLDLTLKGIDELGDRGEQLGAFGDLFGSKLAAKMNATFETGKAGFDAMTERANELGQVVNEKDLRALGALADDIDAVGVKFKVAFASGLAEGLTGETGELRDIMTDPAFKQGIDNIAAGINAIGQAIGAIPSLGDKLAEIRELGSFDFSNFSAFGPGLSQAVSGLTRMRGVGSTPAAPAGPVQTGMSLIPEASDAPMSIASASDLAKIAQQIEDNTAKVTTLNAATTSHSAAVKEVAEAYDFQSEAQQDALDWSEQLADMYRANEAAILGVDEATLAYGDRIAQLDTLLANQIISLDQYRAAAKRVKDEIDGIKSVADFAEENTDRIKAATSGLFSDLITDGKNWKDHLLEYFQEVADSFAKMAADMAAQAIFGGQGGKGGIDWTGVLTNLFSSAVGGAVGGGSWAGDGGSYSMNSTGHTSWRADGFAEGGIMPANQWSLVGENGPELVMSARASRVFTNDDTMDMLGSRGTTVNNNWVFKTPDADSFEASRRQIQRKWQARVGV